MNLKNLFSVGSALLLSVSLSGCGDFPVTMNYKLSEPVDLELFTEVYYTTYDEKDEEHVGTHTKTWTKARYSSSGDTVKVHRNYVMDNSQGYLKNYMPTELAWRVKTVNVEGVDLRVTKVDSLKEGFDSLAYRLPMPTKWRDELLNPSYKSALEKAEGHRWRMTHLLTGTIKDRGNITEQLREQGRLSFGLIRVDSVVVKGFTRRDRRHCLEYVVYLEELEMFPYYVWEQHVNTKIVDEKYKRYNQGRQVVYQTELQVDIDPETGVPCFEHETKNGVLTMVNPETKDTATFKTLVTAERHYNLKRASEGDAE